MKALTASWIILLTAILATAAPVFAQTLEEEPIVK